MTVPDDDWLHRAGTSPAAVAHHYDLSDEFFALWLGPELVYSCALWEGDPADTLAAAQRRKLDWFAQRLDVTGRRVLDIGCGWGALLDRFVREHGAAHGTGLTLSRCQQAYAAARAVPGVEYRYEHWADHAPVRPYDAITCIEATEHLASDELDADAKVEVYRAFFERCASWLSDEGRMGLQLICLDNVGHEGSRPGRGPLSELIRTEIFPESMPASLSEMVMGWETHFRLEQFVDHADQYRRTFRSWGLAVRGHETRVRELVGDAAARAFAGYFATGEVVFGRREQSLYRVVLRKRPQPKRWATVLRPGALPPAHSPAVTRSGASPAAVQEHYDVSDAFYACWLDDSLMYTSGLWDGPADDSPLLAATQRKIDAFAGWVLPSYPAYVLDVGCGWGGALRRLVSEHDVAGGVGLTLSRAQRDHVAASPVPGVDVRLEGWEQHRPDRPYDAIVSFGAFEHFARDGTTSVERVGRYREFFARCFQWLRPDGRLGMETIAHDDAPDTAAPLGRGPLGDAVLEIFPESICPHLSELVLGFEPWFEVRLLRSDAGDFARTCREWGRALRAHESEATSATDAPTVRRYREYLASSQLQFRLGTITNYRLVLQRRPALRW